MSRDLSASCWPIAEISSNGSLKDWHDHQRQGTAPPSNNMRDRRRGSLLTMSSRAESCIAAIPWAYLLFGTLAIDRPIRMGSHLTDFVSSLRTTRSAVVDSRFAGGSPHGS